MSGFDVLALGELNPDLILTGLSADGPVIGTEQIFQRERLVLGSSTAISCVLMQRLGLRTALASAVGDDRYGRFCRDALLREGVDTARVRVEPGQETGVTLSVVYPGDRLLLTRLGIMAFLDGSIAPGAEFDAFRHVHCGSLFLLDRLRGDLPEVLRRARADGCTVSVDPGWDPSGRWDPAALAEILPLTDVFLPNRAEARAMTGTDGDEEALDELRALGARRVAMKAGAEGGLCQSPAGLIRQEGFPAEVVDTTGAGDAFNAGFVRGMLAGWAEGDCLRLAVACGSMAVTAEGGTGGLASLGQARDRVAAAGEMLPDI
ncbi:carbohydrate kinase family protein [Roseisalinus antarcticus]|uniref:Putative sugar kinase YdjH n=1 Tax=Roseisalinus antarcticus TaxID=254357 RepID=A0A1Y5TWS6_9RHOB|nr:sugar kinase [Roseisalinus antarcticus]SLN74246.1 putative sugar kinase YdjH [Roseisalinus antarcticus]